MNAFFLRMPLLVFGLFYFQLCETLLWWKSLLPYEALPVSLTDSSIGSNTFLFDIPYKSINKVLYILDTDEWPKHCDVKMSNVFRICFLMSMLSI